MAITDPKWPKVYDPAYDNGDPLNRAKWRWEPAKWRWEPKLGGIDDQRVQEIVFWREQAEYWKDRYTKALKTYESLFPAGEAAGRIVMLFWDGKTWIRLPEAATSKQDMAEQERLAEQVAYDREVNRLAYEQAARMTEINSARQTFQIAVPEITPEKPKPPKIERVRRNNVVE